MSKQRPQKGVRPERNESPLRVTWAGFRPLYDFWGNEIPRFYQLETFARAVEFALKRRERFIVPSIERVLGPVPLTKISIELFQEGKYQLIFHIWAANAKRRTAQFAMVAAKRAGDFSAVAMAEHQNLRVLHERAPDHVVKPYLGGNVFLPDRYQRAEKGRDIYVYLTQWLSGFHELGVTKNLQFYINTRTPHTFTIAQTEHLKSVMVETIAKTYSDGRQDCMTLPEIASGDFVVTPPPKNGMPRLKLIACRSFMRRVTPAKLLHRIAEASWEWGSREFKIIPEDPALTFAGVARARGKGQAREWFRDYLEAVAAGKLPELEALPLKEVEQISR